MNLKDKLTNMDIKEVFNTPKGKGIAAGLLLIVVVLIIAVVGTLAVPKSGDEDTNTVVKTETPPASQATTDTATATTDTATATTDTATATTDTATATTDTETV
ncbi:MAG: hypothetical protein IBX64_06525, partial [Actinobacteria bacterium]|nr:hypothetical protein [Actinomycetota bacterium]